MPRRLLTLSLTVASCAMAAAWNWRVESYQGSRKTIKFPYVGTPEDARHKSALLFKEIVELKSNGAIQVEFYYGGQLGGDRDAIEGVKLGTLEMTVAGAGIFANFEAAELALQTLGRRIINLHIKDFSIFRPPHNKGFIVEGASCRPGRLGHPCVAFPDENTRHRCERHS